MANIKTHLNNIKGALYGKDVRGSIHDGIDAINKEVENTTGRQVDLENTFDQLVINAGNSNAEIVDARVKNDGTSYSKLGDRLDAVDSQLAQIPIVTPENFGAKCDGVCDDSIAINNAINYLNTLGGGVVKLSKGKEYLLGSVNSNSRIIECKSNITIEGDALLKIKDNLGDYHSIFSFENCKNINFKGFTVDENTTRNPITSNTGEIKPRITFTSWHSDTSKVNFENITINDCVGVWQITVGDMKKRVEGITIKNCVINYNIQQLNLSYDRTSIYLGCDNGVIDGCLLNGGVTFINANTGIEFHGNNIRAINNRIINYNAGFFVCNDTECATKNDNLIIENNYLKVKNGVLLWLSFDNRDVNLINVKNNYIEFTNRGVGTYDLQGKNCVFKNIIIEKNTLNGVSENSMPFAFIEVNNVALNTIYENVYILHNTVNTISKYFFQFESQPNSVLSFKNFLIKENYFKSDISYLFKYLQRTSNDSVVISNNTFEVNTVNKPQIYGENTKAIIFKDNDLKNITIDTFITDKPMKVVQYIDNFEFIKTQSISNYKNKFIEGSEFKSNKMNLKVLNLDSYRFISNGIVVNIPSKCFIDKGSEIFIMSEGNKKVVTKAGYTWDKVVNSDTTNLVDEWVKYGLYVYKVVKENNSTSVNDSSLFAYIGEAVVME